MATPAQIAANIANAQKCTGPRTELGKANSRKNAIRHGLCGFITCLDDEDTSEVKALLADLMEEHQPQGPTEQILTYKMAEQFWLTKRASYYLAVHTMYNEGRGDGDDDRDAKQLALYLRYYTSADRAFNKNLHDLRKLQKERRQQEAEAAIGFVSQSLEPPPAVAESPAEPAPPTVAKPVCVASVEQIPATVDVIYRSEPKKQAA